jgi:hypothetical protein
MSAPKIPVIDTSAKPANLPHAATQNPPQASASPNAILESTRLPAEASARPLLDAYVAGYPKMAARMGLIPETAMIRPLLP